MSEPRETDPGSALRPAPEETTRGQVRRWWLARGHHRGLRYWLLFWGIPLLVAFAALFTINGIVVGWRISYDVMIGITSPAATAKPALSWVLSVAGWLFGPAVAGAVAGAGVTTAITGRRRRPVTDLFREVDGA